MAAVHVQNGSRSSEREMEVDDDDGWEGEAESDERESVEKEYWPGVYIVQRRQCNTFFL
jgi:hypothetical protein